MGRVRAPRQGETQLSERDFLLLAGEEPEINSRLRFPKEDNNKRCSHQPTLTVQHKHMPSLTAPYLRFHGIIFFIHPLAVHQYPQQRVQLEAEAAEAVRRAEERKANEFCTVMLTVRQGIKRLEAQLAEATRQKQDAELQLVQLKQRVGSWVGAWVVGQGEHGAR